MTPTESHRVQLAREKAAAALVAAWFGTNPGLLETYTIADGIATVTLRTTITPEEHAEYTATLTGRNPAEAIRAALRKDHP